MNKKLKTYLITISIEKAIMAIDEDTAKENFWITLEENCAIENTTIITRLAENLTIKEL